MDEGMFGDDRDGDKAVMDWLVAVTDNEELILAHYDEMDTDTVELERLLVIFKRVNRIDETEAHQKNPGGSSGITLDRAVAMIAAHLGVVDEKQIDNMSFVFFEDVLDALGHKLHYDAVVRCW